MVEHRLCDRLAIIERSFDGERMDVVVLGRGHHAPLHVRDAAAREQNEKIGAGPAAERLDGRAAGVARGRDHDRGALAARRQGVVHEPAEELHGQILEGQRRSMEQLEHEIAHPELRQRGDRGMAEISIGLPRHAGEVVLGDGVAHEGPHHLDRHLRIGPSGKARQHGLAEAERRGFTPG